MTKLEEARQKLQFVSRRLSNDYIDYDTLEGSVAAIAFKL